MLRRLLALLILLPSLAFAGSVPLSWTAPTTRTDGSALTNLASYNVYRASTAAGLATAVKLTSVTAPTTTYTDNAPGGQTWFYTVTAVDAQGIESAQSNPVSAVVPIAKPNPPGGLTVGSITAYTFEKSPQNPDKLAFLPVGTVQIGTGCDTTQPVGAYFVVPRAAVKFFGTVQPPVVVAQCG